MIIEARRAPRIHRPSRSQRPGFVLGLRYERRVVKELKSVFGTNSNFTIEHNPWFFYKDSSGESSACSPDILLTDTDLNHILVIEIKYTWVPDAITKLNNLYCPVVTKALGWKTKPLVMVKRLTMESPQPRSGLLNTEATPLYCWSEIGPILL